MLERTPLYPVYSEYEGAKFVDFGGWELPVHFKSGIIAEHMAVRNAAGLFDVSHMGEIVVEGQGSAEFLDRLLTNAVSATEPGKTVYTLMCYPDGGVVDDLIVYRLSDEKFLLVVNASNTAKDFSWITGEAARAAGVKNMPGVRNASLEYAQLALQGPKAELILKKITGTDLSGIGFFSFRDGVAVAGRPALVSRTGYTGEDGFEIYIAPEDAPGVWTAILEAGLPEGILPCGLGARDTLRFEAKLPLYGHEISETVTPLEAGLSAFVDFSKKDFIGKNSLQAMKEAGIPREIRGCEMLDKGVPRQGYPVMRNGRKIGTVTTGTISPMLNAFLALVLVERGVLRQGDEFEIEINGNARRAKVVKTPFYKKTGKK